MDDTAVALPSLTSSSSADFSATTPQLHETSSAGANGLTAGSCEATCRTYDVASFTFESAGAARHFKKPKITPACSSEFHSLDAATPDCAVLPLPLPSLVVPLPACPLPAAHLAPNVDYPSLEACTQLRSSSFVFGIAPVLHSGPEHVQATSHIAVDGPTS